MNKIVPSYLVPPRDSVTCNTVVNLNLVCHDFRPSLITSLATVATKADERLLDNHDRGGRLTHHVTVERSFTFQCFSIDTTMLSHGSLRAASQSQAHDFFFFLFNFTYSRWTSLPSCLWSQRIFPSLPGSHLTFFFVAMQVQHSYNSSTNG